MTSTLAKMTDLATKAKDAFESTKKYEQQVVTIVGESVSFVPTGLSEGETVIVEFDKYYKPEGISDEDYQILVKTMRVLFDGKRKAVADPDTGEDSESFVNEALPPCSEKEKFLVLESLLFRKRVLLQQLYNQGILTPEEMKKKINEMRTSKRDESVEGKETLFVRTLLIHLLRLEKFIKFYVETQSCINVEDIVHETLELDLSDDRIKELLKQFVFFLLQSSHPLKDYTKVHPTAPAFVARLEKNLLKDKFPKFLDTYKNNKFPIPVTLAKVLEATDIDPEALKKQASEAILFERLKIIKHIRDIIPSTDPFWKKIGDPQDPIKIIDGLKERNDSLLDEIKRLESEKADLDKKLKTCEQAQRGLQTEKIALQKRITDLEELLKTRTDQATQLQQLRDQKAAMEADFNRRFQDLHYQIFFCEEEKKTLEQRVAELTRMNQALNDEIVPLRQSAQRLAELQAEVDRNMEELRRRHQAALAEEQARTAEKEQARVAAVAATEEARNQLIAKQEELVRTETILQTVRDSIVQKDQTIANLQRTVNECEGNVANLREEIQRKNEEIRQLQAEIQQGKDKITALEEELTNLRQQLNDAQAETGLLKEEVRQAKELLEKLQNDLQAEKAKVQEKEIALRACEEEKARLKSTASGSSQEVAKLSGDLALAKEERDASIAKIGVLEATIKSLQEQLADSKEEASAHKALLAERNVTIRDLEEDIESKNEEIEQKKGEADAERERADTAEGNVARLEDEKRRLVLNSERRLQETRTQLQQTFDEGLQKVRAEYEENLEKEKEKCDEERETWEQEKGFLRDKIQKILQNIDKAREGVEETKTRYEAILARERKEASENKALLEAEKRVALEDKASAESTLARLQAEYTALKTKAEGTETEKEKILKVVKDMATWVDSGEETEGGIEIGEDNPASSELQIILKKLSEETPQTPTTPTTEKVKSIAYLCYLVFLTAFLWQTNFPKLSDTPPTDTIQLDSYTRQKLIQTLFPALFNGGSRPQAEMWATPTGTKTSSVSSTFLFRSGLYSEIETLSAGRTTKAKFDGKLQVERDSIARYLNILNKIARAMENPSKDGSILGFLPIDLVYIEELFKKLKVLLGDYKVLYTRLDLPTQFASLVGNLMIVNQPLINGALLDRYLVQDESGVRVVTKTKDDTVEPSPINYAVLFYCFLVVMRDNLNHIQQTARNAQCPLPPFLVKPPTKK